MVVLDNLLVPFLFFGFGLLFNRIIPCQSLYFIILAIVILGMAYIFYKIASEYDPFSEDLDETDDDNDDDLNDPDFINDDESNDESDSEEEVVAKTEPAKP